MNVKKLFIDSRVPFKENVDAGLDLYYHGLDILIRHGEIYKLSSGVALGINEGFFGLIRDRSGMAAKGIAVLGGVVDQGYRGEVFVVLTNLNHSPTLIKSGDRIAQLLILKQNDVDINVVDELDETSRGEKGFGSSGS